MPVKELCRKHGFSEASYYLWRGKFGGMEVSDAKRLKALVRWMTPHGLSERQALRFIGMSASSLRYQPAADRNAALRERIVQLAHRHRRYGAGMVYLKLRQAATV